MASCVYALCVQGPVYVQSVGGVMLLGGFFNYFALANANGLSSALWTGRCLTCVALNYLVCAMTHSCG